MGIAEVFLLIIVGIMVLDLFVMNLYCFIAEKLDIRYFDRKNQKPQESGELGNVLHNEKIRSRKRIYKIYLLYNSYFYGLMRYSILCVGKIPSHRIRKLIYKYIFRMKISKKSIIYGGCEIRSPWNIEIGNSVISVGCILDGRQCITIGNNVVFGSGVHLWTEEHNLNDPEFRVLEENSQGIVIEDRAWICSDSTILPGIHIGEGAVVAARACITKDCEPYTVYGGVPGKIIGTRNRDLTYTLLGKPTWHFY